MASLELALAPYDIPSFTLSGVLPPFLGPNPAGLSALMSPYPTSLVKVVERFATSPTRVKLLKGFLAHRKALAGIGLTHGFQWLAGSFLEDIETVERRDPRDVDLITFFKRPILHSDDYAWQIS